ncbi:hypothetical protein N7G274_000147 [Stereocaulon virgatum]|uniref:Uncharacterized protein n=1 Tax=Stereocaulon virgatum TaxID=373712 RepID=A0ABR4ARQ4_9LECA
MVRWGSERAYHARKEREHAEHERHRQAVEALNPLFDSLYYIGQAVYISHDYHCQSRSGHLPEIYYIQSGRHDYTGNPQYRLQTRDGRTAYGDGSITEREGWFRSVNLRIVPREQDGWSRIEKTPPPSYQHPPTYCQ